MRGVYAVLLAAMSAACGSSKEAEPAKVPLSQAPVAAPASGEAAAPSAMPAQAPAEAGAARAAAAPAGALAGPVLERLDAPPYSYLKIKTVKGETWAAVPATQVKQGEMVRVYNPMPMGKFESKSLKRTFDEVYFGTLTADGSDANFNGAGPAAPMGKAKNAPSGGMGANPHAGTAAQSSEPPAKVGKVAKAAGADAKTIAETWAAKDALNGKTVTIRGVVVKYNAQVMGKNWLHLQDGSGDATTGTNDITVVTMDEVAKGATVTIRGTVKTSQDYGAGYKYAVIVEDAKVVKP